VLKILIAIGSSVGGSSSSSPPPGMKPISLSELQQDLEKERRIKEGAERFRQIQKSREEAKSKGLEPEPYSLEPRREPTPAQKATDNPLFQDFQNGTR
jgi:hypothetical protein